MSNGGMASGSFLSSFSFPVEVPISNIKYSRAGGLPFPTFLSLTTQPGGPSLFAQTPPSLAVEQKRGIPVHSPSANHTRRSCNGESQDSPATPVLPCEGASFANWTTGP